MSCDEFQRLLNEELDEGLEPDRQITLDAHLAECAECRSEREALAEVDAALLRGLRPMRTRADALAEQVIERLAAEPQRRRSPTLRGIILALVSLAAGFLIAVLLFRPWEHAVVTERPITGVDQTNGNAVDGTDTSRALPPAATIIAATGPVEVQSAPEAEWVSVTEPAAFLCPSNSSVRTPENVVCELKTNLGCLVRMNASTQVGLDDDELQLGAGQLWCQTPDSAPLTVVAEPSTTPQPIAIGEQPWMIQCPTGSTFVASCSAGNPLVVTSGSGEVNVVTPKLAQKLASGDSCEVGQGGDVKTERSRDPLLDQSWMHPLLVRKGFVDQELLGRVDGLLAQIGQAKMSFLYERDIRSLGEYAALPLLKYVGSPISADNVHRRQSAASILADVAPPWMMPELIRLLDDTDPEVRVSAAQSLARLTGRTPQIAPEQWRESETAWGEERATWVAWWNENRHAFPSPPEEVQLANLRSFLPPGDAGSMLKTRN